MYRPSTLRKHTALGARYRRLRVHVGHGRECGRSAIKSSKIAYLLAEQTTYRKLGTDYFDRYRAEQLKRRSLAQLQHLGSRLPSPTPPGEDFS